MANNKIQVKRTNVSGRTANVTSSGNTQFIDAGELALNMADGILYTSNGSALITVGANLVNQRITNSFTIDNNKAIRFQTVNTSAVAYFIQQNDDNFVFYSTNTSYGARPVYSIFANSNSSELSFAVPVRFNANVTVLTANGSTGTAGQFLTSNGTATYWSSGGTGTVTSVATGNGITGGTITSTGTLTAVAGVGVVVNTSGINVLANNGITSNSTGTFAKAANGISVDASGINVLPNTGIIANATGVYLNTTAQYTWSNNQSFSVGANAIILSNATQNWIWWNTVGVAIPSVTTRSAGTKLALYPSLSATQVDYAIGIESNHMWFSTDNVTTGCKWYANTTNYMTSNVAGLYHTGVVNGSSHTVGSSFIANATGVYHTGTINATSYTVGTSFTANSTVTNTVSLVVSTNTATIGTGTYFVSNGNVGIGNNTPVTKLYVEGTIRAATVRSSYYGDNGGTTRLDVSSADCFFSNSAGGEVVRFASNGNVGIGTASPVYKLEVSGSFAATTKSFVIDHPSKKGMKLRHGSLEGPENGVYVRGRTNTNIIELPDYWVKLIDKDSITVSLTAIGKTVCPSVGKITNKKINLIGNDIDCFFHVFAERKDVEKLVVEY